MSIPAPNSSVWADVVSGKKNIEFEFLAAKIFMGSAQVKIKQDPGALSQIAVDLYNLFQKNLNLPSVQRDLQKIL